MKTEGTRSQLDGDVAGQIRRIANEPKHCRCGRAEFAKDTRRFADFDTNSALCDASALSSPAAGGAQMMMRPLSQRQSAPTANRCVGWPIPPNDGLQLHEQLNCLLENWLYPQPQGLFAIGHLYFSKIQSVCTSGERPGYPRTLAISCISRVVANRQRYQSHLPSVTAPLFSHRTWKETVSAVGSPPSRVGVPFSWYLWRSGKNQAIHRRSLCRIAAASLVRTSLVHE